jgi:hypothetical protein
MRNLREKKNRKYFCGLLRFFWLRIYNLTTKAPIFPFAFNQLSFVTGICYYTLMAGREPEACHGAEADCLTLLKAVAVCGSAFTTWLTESATPFLEVKKM